MPADRFTFAIWIRSEIDTVNLTRFALEGFHDLPFSPNQDILRSKGILNIDTQFLRREVPDMSNGGFNDVIPT